MKKVYLETPEAVIKALKDGKEIKDIGDFSYKMIDGFIVSKNKDGCFWVGDSVSSIDNPYIEEKEPLKIEVGKFYKTRNGEKARCFFKYINGGAVFAIDFCSDIFKTDAKGKCVSEFSLSSSLDIIGPWEN